MTIITSQKYQDRIELMAGDELPPPRGIRWELLEK
jgi:hypothetical protein